MFIAQNYEYLLGTPGFSDKALQAHFTLYRGYVNNANKLQESLAQMLKEDKTGAPEFAELKRRFGWEFNGMRLHEYYFGSLKNGGKKPDTDSALHKKIIADFGSFADWEKDFRATASLRGIGWAILYYDRTSDRLFNVWVNEHDAGHLAGEKIILPLDAFEHAFLLDYGVKRADYIEAFIKAIDWTKLEKNFS